MTTSEIKKTLLVAEDDEELGEEEIAEPKENEGDEGPSPENDDGDTDLEY